MQTLKTDECTDISVRQMRRRGCECVRSSRAKRGEINSKQQQRFLTPLFVVGHHLDRGPVAPEALQA